MTELRPYRPGDESGVRELFRVCHKRKFPAALWDWRYRRTPGGSAIIDVAVDGGRVVAHLAALPVRLERGEEALPAAQWVDLMVDPAYRDLNLFLDLAEANRARCAAAGRELIFGFPNDRSHPLLKRLLDWQAVEEIVALEAPLKSLASPRTSSSWGAAPCLEASAEFDVFWAAVRPRQALAVRRDRERLAWRYLSKPGSGYGFWAARDEQRRLCGWLAAKVFAAAPGPIGDILDFWVSDGAEPAVAGLWAAALGYFRTRSVLTVSAWALRQTPGFERYRKLGLNPVGPCTHFAGRWAAADRREPFPGLGRDWLIAKGDSDVF